jgi:hypothetical protein
VVAEERVLLAVMPHQVRLGLVGLVQLPLFLEHRLTMLEVVVAVLQI